jgi:hypothetical protein
MRPRSLARIFVLLLAVFVTAGVTLSVVQANGMATKMAMMSDMGDGGHGHCDACPDVDSGAKSPGCSPFCVAPALIVLQSFALAVPTSFPTSFRVQSDQLDGLASPPDPSPPRPTDIG